MFDKRTSLGHQSKGADAAKDAGGADFKRAGRRVEPPVSRICSVSGGVVPMSIEGRMRFVRERLSNMTPEERRWRAQWQQDQILAPNEPRYVPEYYKSLKNPIRRFYNWPLDQLLVKMQPYLGLQTAAIVRSCIGKAAMGLALIYAGYYHIKYHSNGWEKPLGWMVLRSRSAVYPGDPDYPLVSDKVQPWDYDTSSFRQRTAFRGGLY